MQAKISAFFKPSAPGIHDPPLLSDQIEAGELSCKKSAQISVTYKRRDPKPNPPSSEDEVQLDNMDMGRMNEISADSSLRSGSVGKILNKKRSYAQYHLELGQSDFLLHACSICGMMYARGAEGDEKAHKAFHKNYYQGIQFKGWRVERVVSTCNEDRIVLVLDSDPPAQKHKVQQVIKVMERELGFIGQLLHKLCKAYLFIASHRIVGCLIAEPIRAAHKVISTSISCSASDDNCTTRDESDSPESEVSDAEMKRPNSTSLQFGNIRFQREVIRKGSSKSLKVNQWDRGAILCEEEALPALCGVRAIWVVPLHRRKKIASRLLDAVRQSFLDGRVLQLSEFAISPPTSAGRAFFGSYTCSSKAVLVYRTA